jgi:hypothetical protein
MEKNFLIILINGQGMDDIVIHQPLQSKYEWNSPRPMIPRAI